MGIMIYLGGGGLHSSSVLVKLGRKPTIIAVA